MVEMRIAEIAEIAKTKVWVVGITRNSLKY
jgi:hypothetical protein